MAQTAGHSPLESLEHPDFRYIDQARRTLEKTRKQQPRPLRVESWVVEHQYPIIGATWASTMAIALALMRREPVLFGAQKLVQARVFAQGATLAMVIATAALEVGGAGVGKGKYETVVILDPDDPAQDMGKGMPILNPTTSIKVLTLA